MDKVILFIIVRSRSRFTELGVSKNFSKRLTHQYKIPLETFQRNIEKNDVANRRNIAREGTSKWLLGHNVRPLGAKKDIVIVCGHVKQGGFACSNGIKGASELWLQ